MTGAASGAGSAAATGGRRAGAAAAALLLAYVALYVAPAGVRPLFSPDEVRYAEIPREMLASGDWVVPRLAGLRYFEKPPLGYWVNAISIGALGEHAFAARLPGALSAGLTALLVAGFARRLSGSAMTGVLAAAVYLTSLEVYVLANINVLDNLLTLWLTAALVAFHRAATAAGAREERRFALLAGAAVAGAFLTKGFLALAVAAIVVAPWMALAGRIVALLRITAFATLSLVLVSLPWAVLVHLREGDYWHYFFWVEHVRRFFADDAQHREPAYFFLVFLPFLAFPWLALAPAAVAGARREPRDAAHWRFVWWWLLAPFAFFSASQGKLLTYLLPCFPAFAVLVAAGSRAYLAAGRTALARYGLWCNALALAAVLVGIAAMQAGLAGRPLYGAGEGLRVQLLAGALLAGAAIALHAARTREPRRLLLGAVFTFVPLVAVSQFAVPAKLVERKAFARALEAERDGYTEDTVLVANSGTIHAVAWQFRRDDVYLTAAGELAYGLAYPDGQGRLLDADGFRALVAANAGRRPVLVACKRSCDFDVTALAPGARHRVSGLLETWYLPAGPGPGESDALR